MFSQSAGESLTRRTSLLLKHYERLDMVTNRDSGYHSLGNGWYLILSTTEWRKNEDMECGLNDEWFQCASNDRC